MTQHEIDKHIVVNTINRGPNRFLLRIWNSAGTTCEARGLYRSEAAALAAGRKRLAYLLD